MGMMLVGCANGRGAGVCREACIAMERTVVGGLRVSVLEGMGGECVQTAFLWRICLGCTCINLPGHCSFIITTSSQQFTIAYMKVLVPYAKHCFNFSSVFVEDYLFICEEYS